MTFLVVTLTMMMIMTTTSFPTGSPGCDYSPTHGHQTAPQKASTPHNVLFNKTELDDGKFVLTMQSDFECPAESVYVENIVTGFLVKTTARGDFMDTEGVQVLRCEDRRTKAVTHIDRKAKANIRIEFMPHYTETYKPDFIIILVRDFSTFWVDIIV